MRVTSPLPARMLLQLRDFGAIKLAHGQLCEAAVVGWDVERERLALLNLSAIERGSGLIGAKDSALDCAQWLGRGLGDEVAVLSHSALQRCTLTALEWPILGFAASPRVAAGGERLELPWHSIRALWITGSGLESRVAS